VGVWVKVAVVSGREGYCEAGLCYRQQRETLLAAAMPLQALKRHRACLVMVGVYPIAARFVSKMSSRVNAFLFCK